MKKLVCLLVVLVFLLSSCAENNAGAQNEETINYSVITKDYIDKDAELSKDIKISYPQIKDFPDKTIESSINTFIEKETLFILDDFTSLDGMSITVSYKLECMSNQILSISFDRNTFHNAQSYPNIGKFGVTIDLTSGKELHLNEIVSDYTLLLEKLQASEFIYPYNDGVIDNDYREQINSTLESVLTLDSLYRCDDKDYPDLKWYLKKDNLVIVASIPHIFGDFVLYEIEDII